jgi:hypothetical protein
MALLITYDFSRIIAILFVIIDILLVIIDK